MLTSRLPIATSWGVLLTLVTFWALWNMTSVPINIGDRITASPIEFTRQLVDSAITTKKVREKVTRDPPPDLPDTLTIKVPSDTTTTARVPPLRPGIETGIPIQGPVAGTDQDASPEIRIRPQYPPSAERQGIEGWVQVQFSVSATGMVKDLVVVDASPPGVFEEETLEALRRWRYSPKVEDGIAVERVGLQTVIVFELQD